MDFWFIRSDELNCTSIKPRTNIHTFGDAECAHPDRMCATNAQCIRVHQFCDGIKDCPDGEYLISHYIQF